MRHSKAQKKVERKRKLINRRRLVVRFRRSRKHRQDGMEVGAPLTLGR